MPLDLQIIRASEFVKLGARQQMDFEESKVALRELARACRKRGVGRALLDLRELPIPEKPKFTPSELAKLVETFHEAGFGKEQRLAVLYRSDPHRGVRMFAFIGTMRGWQVRAFSEFEPALLWLSEQHGSETEREAQPIPIKVSRRRVAIRPETDWPGGGRRQ